MASKSLLTQVTAARADERPRLAGAHALASRWRSERSAAPVRADDESGAILVLALVFLVAVSLIVTGLLTFVGTSLTRRVPSRMSGTSNTRPTDAVNLAIQNTRYQFDAGSPTPFLNNPSPELCATYSVPNETVSVDVYCSMVWQPFSANTRVFTYWPALRPHSPSRPPPRTAPPSPCSRTSLPSMTTRLVGPRHRHRTPPRARRFSRSTALRGTVPVARR